MVRREDLERQRLAVIQKDILPSESVAYLGRRVNEALARAKSQRPVGATWRPNSAWYALGAEKIEHAI